MRFFLLLALAVMLSPGCKSKPAVQPTPKPQSKLEQLKQQAETGDPKAQYQLGALYAKLYNPVEAAKWYRQAAERGVADAQYALGQMYATGDGLGKDSIEAYTWFCLASAQGNRPAMNGRNKLIQRLGKQDIEEGDRRAFAYVKKGAVPKDVIVKDITPEVVAPASPTPGGDKAATP